MTGHVDRMLERHFAGELDPADQAIMRAHLRECSRCQEEHDAVATLLRVAAGAEPTEAEFDRWQGDLEVRLGWATHEAPPEPARPLLGSWLLAPMSAALALALVVAALLVLLPRDEAPPEHQIRGGAPSATLASLELTAVSQEPGGAPKVRRLDDGDTANLGEYLQLRYQVHGPGLGFLYLFGLDGRSRPLDYYPRPSSSRSIAIEEALSPRSVGRSIRLAKRHQPGTLWVVAMFSPQPLERAEVHEWVIQLAARGVDPADLPKEQALATGVVTLVRAIRLEEAQR